MLAAVLSAVTLKLFKQRSYSRHMQSKDVKIVKSILGSVDNEIKIYISRRYKVVSEQSFLFRNDLF
jgi:hypothetical protein